MISVKSCVFRYVDRGYTEDLVLVPGWATDYRIFDSLELKSNYVLPVDFSPFTFERDLLCMLEERGTKKVSLFGWSLGGFVVARFAAKKKDLISKLILVSIRRKYKKEEIEGVKNRIRQNKRAYLYRFYRDCFPQEEDMRWFRKNLFRDYCERFTEDYLLETLDYLGKAEIDPEALSGIENIEIIHGGKDSIAPLEEALLIKGRLPGAKFVRIENTGHIPFRAISFTCPPKL